jgi:hypothetical protein
MKQHIIFLFIGSFIFQQGIGQNNSSIKLRHLTISSSGSSETIQLNNNSYTLRQSIGQSSIIGIFNNDNYEFRQGFLQSDLFLKIKNKNIPLSLNLIVYPNPFTEGVNLIFKEPIFTEIEVTLYDMLGRILLINNFDKSQDLDLKLFNIVSANYIIKVVANQKQFIKTIVKK